MPTERWVTLQVQPDIAVYGGCLSESGIKELSFNTINGQSYGDRVLLNANGVANLEGGTGQSGSPAENYLKYGDFLIVDTLSLANGIDATIGKWSVSNIEVSYLLDDPACSPAVNVPGVVSIIGVGLVDEPLEAVISDDNGFSTSTLFQYQ
ncbi:hypothetical protein OAM69_07825, partial [bacterium]|nr:hypothetical protein [bacterium]